MAEILIGEKRFAEAREKFQLVLTNLQRAYDPEHFEMARCLERCAVMLHAMEEKLQALFFMRRAYEIFKKNFGGRHADARKCKALLRTWKLSQ